MRKSPASLISLCSLVLLLALPFKAEAYSYFSSSMTATCMGTSCSTVRFQLDVAGQHRLFGVAIENLSPDIAFTGINSITDSNGQQVNWWTKVLTSSQLEAEWAVGLGWPASEPIVLHVATSGFAGGAGTAGMSYAGVGCEGLSDCNQQFLTSGSVTASTSPGPGTVTPEPETVVLLAIGLALLGGVAFMRNYV